MTYATGLGATYDIFNRTQYAVIAFFVLYIIMHYNQYRINKKLLIILAGVLFSNIITYVQYEKTISSYVWVWLLIPLYAIFKIEKSDMKFIGWFYGIAGFVVLYFANYTDTFKGWDGNSISLIVFMSYIVFIATYADIRDKGNIIFLVIYSLIYFYLLNALGSRSVIGFSALLLLCVLSVIPFRSFLNKGTTILILLMPLLIAIFVVTIRNFATVMLLNRWSLIYFGKPLFNGRDRIWYFGFKWWMLNPVLGNGNLDTSRWHNSAITCLVSCGLFGYLVFIFAFYFVCKKALKYKEDKIVYGLLCAFFAVWMQQSVELGLISTIPNIMPYAILGLLYSRTHMLEVQNEKDIVNNSSGI